MTGADDFLNAIGNAPSDDAPRLIYADWLDEHGQPERAEFIRVQCELNVPGGPRGRRTELRLRERELLGRFGKEWAGTFAGTCESYRFQRGFVEVISARIGPLLKRPPDPLADRLVSDLTLMHPLVSGRSLTNMIAFDGVRKLRFKIDASLAYLYEVELPEQIQAQIELLDLRWVSLGWTGDDYRQLLRLPAPIRLLVGGTATSREARTELRQALGERVSFGTSRDPDYLYRLTTESAWVTGTDLERMQVLLINVEPHAFRLVMYRFDLDGELLEVTEPRGRESQARRGALSGDRRVLEVAGSIGLVPGSIQVRRFEDIRTGVGIADFRDEQLGTLAARADDDHARHELQFLRTDWWPGGKFDFPRIPV